MTSETDEFQQFMFCRAFCSLESIQNALQNILGINNGGSIPYNSHTLQLAQIQTALGYAKKNRGTSNFPETARMDTPKTEFDARKQQKLTKQLAPCWSFTTQLEFDV